jgi:hypothetical protein
MFGSSLRINRATATRQGSSQIFPAFGQVGLTYKRTLITIPPLIGRRMFLRLLANGISLMKRRLILVSALAIVLLAGSSARADYFYNWGPDNPVVFADHSNMHISISDSAHVGPVSGAQHMVATSLSTFINPGVTGTDTFSQGQQLALGLDLTDGTAAGNVSFKIGVSGSLSADGSSKPTYSFLNGTTQTMTVNGTLYTVTLDGMGTIPGDILATITPGSAGSTSSSGGGSSSPSATPPTTSNAPEPSSLVLAGLSIPLLALVCLWRLRSRATFASPVL